MKTLNKIRFEPASGKGTLYIQDGNFRSVKDITLSSLQEDEQQGAQASLAWLQQLAQSNGFASIEWVYISRLPDQASKYSEEQVIETEVTEEVVIPVPEGAPEGTLPETTTRTVIQRTVIPPSPIEYSPCFGVHFHGKNGEGFDGSFETLSVPGDETLAMNSLWNALQNGLD